jgi:glutathione synthase/RimK-type ligase-like ATP-grasp enzyme
MRIGIIGDPARRQSDRLVVREAQRLFDEAVYAPVTDIRLELAGQFAIRHDKVDLTAFDYVLPIPTPKHRDIFYAILRMLPEGRAPFRAETYLLTQNHAALFDRLARHDIPTRPFFTLASAEPLAELVRKVKFPIIVRPPYARILAPSPRVLRDVICSSRVGVPIRLESPTRKAVWMLITEDGPVASYKLSQKRAEQVKPDRKTVHIAERVRRLIGCDYCALRFVDHMLDQFTFSPDWLRWQEVTGRNVARHVIRSLRKRLDKRSSPTWAKIEKVFAR